MELKTNKYSLFYIFLKNVFYKLIAPYYRVEYRGVDDVKKMEAPYLVLPNHCSFFDPFFINGPLDEKIHYVISDTQLRNPFMKWLLGVTGVIAISKNRSDLKSLKAMTTAIKEQKVVGIFPEGLRTWDGVTLPVIESTAKLIRMLNVPVVVPLIEGGYLMDPRWGKGFRKGKFIITYKILFNGEKTGKKPTKEIYENLVTALDNNDNESENLKGVEFKSRRMAEGIEQILYICPKCHSVSSIRSKKNQFSCSACNLDVEYTTWGILKYPGEISYFTNVYEWNRWQKFYLEELLKEPTEQPLSIDREIILSKPNRKNQFKTVTTGALHLYHDRLEFKSPHPLLIPFKDITGINVQFKERLEFYYNKELYRFHNKKHTFSARKINDVFEMSLK